jgi:hypothetical protein
MHSSGGGGGVGSAAFNGKQWVMQLQRGEEQPMCLACEEAEMYKKWLGKVEEAIRLFGRRK